MVSAVQWKYVSLTETITKPVKQTLNIIKPLYYYTGRYVFSMIYRPLNINGVINSESVIIIEFIELIIISVNSKNNAKIFPTAKKAN